MQGCCSSSSLKSNISSFYHNKPIQHPHKCTSSSYQINQKIQYKKRPSGNYHLAVAQGGAKCSLGSGDHEELWKIERMIRLHSALRNRSIPEFCSLIGDECRRPTFAAQFHPFSLSKKVLQFLLEFLWKNKMMLVIKPATTDNGVDVGLRWIFASHDLELPIGFGCSIYTDHFYEGSVFIRNPENIIKCWIHLETIPQKMEEIFSVMIEKLALNRGILEGRKGVALMYCLLSLVFAIAFLVLFKNTWNM